MTATSDVTIESFKTMVLDEWTAPATIAGWRKWHPGFVVQLRAMADAVIEAAGVRPGMHVLDLATGTGQPALTIARLVGPQGHVTATDISAAMLEGAEANARAAGIANITFRQADAHALPFPDASFDAITCTIGAMYFVEISKALSEVRRVLRPGGRAAFACWGPGDKGTYVATLLGPFFRRVDLPTPPADMPQPLRFAAPGVLAGEIERAGFREVTDACPVLDASWPGSPEEAWQEFYDVAVPMQSLIDGLPSEERRAALTEVLSGLREGYDGERVHLTVSMVITAGTR